MKKTDLNDWSRHISGTFIQLRATATIEEIAANMDKYVTLKNAANEDLQIKSFVFDNLKKSEPQSSQS